MENRISDEQMGVLSDFVARVMGLYFPTARWPELRRGVTSAAAEFEREDAWGWAQSLMAGPLSGSQIEALAHHLTIGETYFYRDAGSFEGLALEVLPALMKTWRGREKRLRIWSAACCTGEEPYTIAMLIQRTIHDWRDWNITLLATDLNPRFLRKAAEGVYGAWSFRSSPAWMKEQYFRPTAEGRMEVRAEVKQMVQFAQLNLVDDVYPSVTNNTAGMDVIFCRNVLMYFSPEQAKNVVGRLRKAQLDDGWLVVGPNELPHASTNGFSPVECQGAIFYRKSEVMAGEEGILQRVAKTAQALPRVTAAPTASQIQGALPAATAGLGDGTRSVPTTLMQGSALPPAVAERHSQGRGTQSEEVQGAGEGNSKSAFPVRARSLANEGLLEEALACCDQWIAAEKSNFAGHYLRAVILLEKGEADEAVASLRRAIYLSPKFVLAHYALGNIARERGQSKEAKKHMDNVIRLLQQCSPEEVVPESDGVTVGRFTQIVTTLIGSEARS